MPSGISLESKIEALLFWKGEPVKVKRLAAILGTSVDDTEIALGQLDKNLIGHGVVLIKKDDEVLMGTAPETADLIEKLTKEELAKDLGKAGLETLAIILYKGPVARREIDFIRGVNSTFIIRNLMIRGLIDRIPNKNDQRSFLYQPTFELLCHLGIKRIEDLPEWIVVKKEIEMFESANQENTGGGNTVSDEDLDSKNVSVGKEN